MNTLDENKDLLTALEVCVLVHCSYNALNYWYGWKGLNPDNEYAKLLPDFIQTANRQTRYWKREDVAKIIQFRNSVPQGRNGIMGDITQKYRREQRKREQNGKQTKSRRSNGKTKQ